MVDAASARAPLFVPANRPDRFTKAATSGTDAVILDLEDAVPGSEKELARNALRCDFSDLPIIVRVNAYRSDWHSDDIAAVRKLPVAAVVLPKSESGEDLAAVRESLGGRVQVLALIESARGLAAAREIAATPGVSRLLFGSVDFCADFGCAHKRELLLPMRAELVLAAKLAGIAAPIDGVTTQFEQESLAYEDACHARDIGMSGKLCIHPKQVSEVRRAFLPAEDEIDWARRVLALGDGAVSLNGAMVDEPVRIRARAILVQAEQA